MNRLYLILLEIALLAGLGIWIILTLTETKLGRPGGVEVTVQLAGARDKVLLYRDADHHYHYLVHQDDGNMAELSPEELAARMHRDRTARSWGQTILNISSPAGYIWVGLGFLGQLLFTGRMIVQWLVSEKQKRSVVPPIFWWMSLVGSTMLMAYFLWRRDPIGLLGQAFGWFIYLRNIWMIYRPRELSDVPQSLGA